MGADNRLYNLVDLYLVYLFYVRRKSDYFIVQPKSISVQLFTVENKQFSQLDFDVSKKEKENHTRRSLNYLSRLASHLESVKFSEKYFRLKYWNYSNSGHFLCI